MEWAIVVSNITADKKVYVPANTHGLLIGLGITSRASNNLIPSS